MIDHTDVNLRTVSPSLFEEKLSKIMTAGGDLLIVGNVHEDTLAYIAALITTARPVQRPARVFAKSSSIDRDRLNLGDTDARFIDMGGQVRSSNTSTASVAPPDNWSSDRLKTRFLDEMTDIHSDRTELEKAQLRLGVFTIEPIIQHGGLSEAQDLIRNIETIIRADSGIADYYLPMPADSDIVRNLTDLVNVRIKVRKQENKVLTKWYFTDLDDSTEWFNLSPSDLR